MRKHWWEKSAAYQIYPKSFYDSNNDGIGDIQGVIEKLPYLHELGIDIIWLSPIYQSPMVDNGYDISDYKKIDSQFGSMEDMRNLIKECDKMGMKVLMDLVVNHTSDQHEWFKEAIRNPKSIYRDYYYFKKGSNGKPPNNWRSIFGGSAWEQVENSDEYYLHIFYKEQPDLNWENHRLRNEIYEMIKFWLDMGLGGFRVDAITHIKKDFSKVLVSDDSDGLADGTPATRNILGIGEFLTEMKCETFEKYNAYTIGEAQGVENSQFSQYCGENGYFSEIFDFEAVEINIPSNGTWAHETDWTPKSFREMLFRRALSAQNGGMQGLFLENHDLVRSLDKFIPREDINYYSSTMLATVYMLLRGTPYIYQGQEIGMTNCKFESIEQCPDKVTHTNYENLIKQGLSKEKAMDCVNRRCRDSIRCPMQWNDSENAGFTKGKPWTKMADNYREINVEAQLGKDNTVLNWYKNLIKLRKESQYSDIICKGMFQPYDMEQDNIISYKREYEDGSILVICNFSGNSFSVHRPEFKEIILNNYNYLEILKDSIPLNPYQALVLYQ